MTRLLATSGLGLGIVGVGIFERSRGAGNVIEGIGYQTRRTIDRTSLLRCLLVDHHYRSRETSARGLLYFFNSLLELESMLIHFLQAVIGAIIWTLANVVYIDLKRKGVRGFTRFAAFWVGNPTTWITFFAVSEGKRPTFHPPPDDDEALLAEIREDRARREIGAGERVNENSQD